MTKLEAKHRHFLWQETIISTVVSAIINLVISFFIFRSQDAIMLWGKGGLFLDLIPTIFFMTFGMTVGITLATRGRIVKGKAPAAPWHLSEHAVLRFLPDLSFTRALLFGVFALLVLLPASTGLLMLLQDFPISFNKMLVFKTFYGALIGLSITPIIVLCAMADKGEVAA